MSIRVAVIGAGVMGADHARIVARDIPGAVLQVVCDASPARARAVADEFGAVDAATEASGVIARDDVDAVLIASPDETHAPLSIAAIEAGKPVLCEKPLAPTSAKCLELIEAETRAGRQWVQVGYMRRFDPAYTEMKAALAGGRIGAAIMMHNFHRNLEAPPHFTGPMAITNSAPHEFDIARFVLGAELCSISAFQPAGFDDRKPCPPVVMVLATDAGQLVTIEVNVNAAYGYDVRGELVGETGSVFLNAPVYSRINHALQAAESYPADWRPRFAEAYRRQDKAWIESIASGRPDPVAANARDGYCASAIAEAGVVALREGQTRLIELAPMPDLYRREA